MKARTQEQYNRAVDILEEMLQKEWRDTDYTVVERGQVDGFIHCICGYMKMAFEQGLNQDHKPNVISAMRATHEPFLKATAAVIESAYTTGTEARG